MCVRFNFNQLLYILLLSFGILFVQIDHSEWGEKHRNESGTHPKKICGTGGVYFENPQLVVHINHPSFQQVLSFSLNLIWVKDFLSMIWAWGNGRAKSGYQ